MMGLIGGYVATTQDHFVAWFGDQQQEYTRADHPQFFVVSALCFTVVGLLLLSGAFYTHFRLKLRSPAASGSLGFSWYAIVMLSLGLIFALVAILSGPWHR